MTKTKIKKEEDAFVILTLNKIKKSYGNQEMCSSKTKKNREHWAIYRAINSEWERSVKYTVGAIIRYELMAAWLGLYGKRTSTC